MSARRPRSTMAAQECEEPEVIAIAGSSHDVRRPRSSSPLVWCMLWWTSVAREPHHTRCVCAKAPGCLRESGVGKGQVCARWEADVWAYLGDELFAVTMSGGAMAKLRALSVNGVDGYTRVWQRLTLPGTPRPSGARPRSPCALANRARMEPTTEPVACAASPGAPSHFRVGVSGCALGEAALTSDQAPRDSLNAAARCAQLLGRGCGTSNELTPSLL